jgi:pyruvate dehydrogenase E1 component alpha subunit
MLESMLRIRAYEATLASIAVPHEEDACTAGGQEACAVGVIAALEPHDRILTNGRSPGHLLARGANPARMLAEVLGRSDGYCKGKGGSLHICSKELGVVLTSAIPGGGLSTVTGVALAQKLGYGVPGGIVATFFSDGAACEGVFHESLNLAATWDLPVLYVCENNQSRGDVHRSETMRTEHISTWAQKFAMPAVVIDGTDVEAVNAMSRDAIAQIRRTSRPYFIELQTYPQRGQRRADDRPGIDAWKNRDPVTTLSDRLLSGGVLHRTDITRLEQRAAAEMQSALLFAQSSPWPCTAELTNDVYA